MGRRAVLVATLVLAGSPAGAHATEGSLELVGHEPLGARGMNSAMAIHGGYAYVGSRSDGPAPKGGIAVVGISDPAHPRVIDTVTAPDEGEPGLSSRELRVWHAQDLLVVLHFACEAPQSCLDYGAPPDVRFYDVRGDLAAHPRLLHTYRPSRTPHEFFLWEDPARPGRALMYMSTLTATGGDDLLVADISGARQGVVAEVASWAASIPADDGGQVDLHSLSVSPDGRTGYVAHLAAGFLMIDTSDLAEARERPRIRLRTPLPDRAQWGKPGAHSALPLPGRPWALTTDEVYGSTFGIAPALGIKVAVGCPWGWARLLDVRDPARPVVRGEYRLQPYNDPSRCTPEHRLESEQATFSSHNPTATRDLAFVSWHSGGLQAIDVSDPAHPRQAAEFRPANLPAVLTEDPTFSTGSDKAVMWSYPVIRDGLIHVVDVRNGLFILRYRGPHEAQVRCAGFLEGNSNLGAGGRQCPLHLPGGRAAVRGTRALVRATCTTRTLGGCAGTVRLLARGRLAGTGRFALGTGREGTLRVGLRPWARRALRSGELRATARVLTHVPGAQPEQATATVRLARARARAASRRPASARAAWAPPRRSMRLARQAPPTPGALLRSGLVCLFG